jgi:hypothetical protein
MERAIIAVLCWEYVIMTDQPESPKPSSTNNLTNNPTVAKVVETVRPIAQKTWRQSRPTLIQILQVATQQLQKLTTQLEAQTAADPVKVAPMNWTPVTRTTQTLTQTLWAKLQPVWRWLLDKLRPILPEAFRPLSDRTLSGILVGTLLLLFWLTSSIPAGQAKPPMPTKPSLTQPRSPQPPASSAPALSAPAPKLQEKPIAAQPQPGVLPDASPNSFPETLTTPQASPAIAPVGSLPSPAVQPKPTPVKLTPAEKLQEAVNTIVADYDRALNPAAQANFANKTLRISLQPAWYTLAADRQDALVAALWQKAQAAKLTTLELVDSQDQVVARSPIVGTEMVVLQRIANALKV